MKCTRKIHTLQLIQNEQYQQLKHGLLMRKHKDIISTQGFPQKPSPKENYGTLGKEKLSYSLFHNSILLKT
jgi:hypothetical protein